MPGGSVTRINPQLRYFKCAELVLLIKMPVVHKVCRKFYDYFGTRLAGNISSAIAADLVYLSLKPVEWFFKLLLKMLVPELDEVANRIYPRAMHEQQIPSWR